MSHQILDKSFPIGANLAAYKIVQFDGAGNVELSDGTAQPVGVSIDAFLATIGYATIRIIGTADILAGAAIAQGERVKSDSTGRATPVTDASDMAIGVSLETVTTANDRCQVLIMPALAGASAISDAVPTYATSPGTAGQIAYDATYIYMCVATDTWTTFKKDGSFKP